jgi:hypothetical protein
VKPTFLHVTACRHIRGHVLWIRFNSGEAFEVDLSDELQGEVFEPLNDVAYFRQFRMSHETRTVEWPNGADFAPEFLHQKGRIHA